ncbi:MAG: UDP-glucose/GDP-mannose dehydrogenase family protein, partial [Acidimicrobiia bacterium]|nr:UDP-glucose/GDP-mannose dehydrogenase family protein [Acidimicrobiia bacterium]
MQVPDPPPDSTHPVAILGAGHVGLVTAVGFAHHGIPVRVGEANPERLAVLQAGGVPFHEPGIAPLVSNCVASGTLTFHASNAEAADGAVAVFLAVPTPAGLDGSADLGAVHAAIRSIAGVTVDSTVIVIKSSVPPGSSHRIRAWMEESGCAGSLAINPEFLQEGRAVEGALSPTRVVIGSNDPVAAEVVARLHAPFNAPVVMTDPASAELTKYAANSYLAMRVTFANTIANLADVVGADIADVVEGIGLDPRIGSQFLRPGPGYGGSCFPKDLPALIATAAERGLDLDLLQAVVDVNAAQIDRVVGKLTDGLETLDGRKVALLGLAFKADTDDLAESPAIHLAAALVAAGASVSAYDPAVGTAVPGIQQAVSALEAMEGADAVLIATEWPDFALLDLDEVAAVLKG